MLSLSLLFPLCFHASVSFSKLQDLNGQFPTGINSILVMLWKGWSSVPLCTGVFDLCLFESKEKERGETMF